MSRLKILITGGATIEPIDTVRFVTNFSSGKTASFIANRLNHFAEITYLHGKYSQRGEEGLEQVEYKDFSDLYDKMEKLISSQKFDYCIHAAAISDFSVDKVYVGDAIHDGLRKISSDDELKILFKQNPKIIKQIKIWDPNIKLFGFKLTSNFNEMEEELAIRKVLSSADYCLHNRLEEISGTSHEFTLYNKKQKKVFSGHSKESIATSIGSIVKENL